MTQRRSLIALLALIAMNAATPVTLQFRGTSYVHRWSKAGQNEFTPPADTDLAKWNDMVTVNVHESVKTGEQLAGVANAIVANYQRRGKILKTDSKPRTAAREAEHLIVGVLGDPAFLEAAFVRCVMVNGVGYAAVYSHRVYGAKAGPAMSEWLKVNGPQVEAALMSWAKLPPAAELRSLPQAK
jgi:hypothetical protein